MSFLPAVPRLSRLLLMVFLLAATQTPIANAQDQTESLEQAAKKFPAGITINDLNKYGDRRFHKMSALSDFLELRTRFPDAAIIDLRASKDFAEGHLKGAQNIPLYFLMPSYLQEIQPDTSKAIFIFHDDALSDIGDKAYLSLPYVALSKYGYQNIYHLQLWRGGLSVEDIKARTPFQTGETEEKPISLRLGMDDFENYLPGMAADTLDAQGFSALHAGNPAPNVLDFRSAPAFAQRHIAGSHRITFDEGQQAEAVSHLYDKNVPVVLVYTHSFMRSPMFDISVPLYIYFKKAGYKDVYRLRLCDEASFCNVQNQPWFITSYADKENSIAMPVPAPPDAPQAVEGALIPPAMGVDEFTAHMAGAQAAGLTLSDFVALRAAEPSLVVLDIRGAEAYGLRHIKGARSLPLTEMTEHTLPQVLPDKNVPVVLVCEESFAPTRRLSMTLQAWPVLKANGYTRLYRLNLWRPKEGSSVMPTPEDIAREVKFEGSAVIPAPPPAQ